MTLARCDDTVAPRVPPVAADPLSWADQLVIALTSVGITNYFGVPGGAIEPLFNALSRQQRAGLVKLTPTRSEAGAAFAADGYYRATGRMAVCTATTGPGITNLLTAVMSAHADRIAMLVITPQVALSKQGRGALQDSSSDGYDLEKMLSECTRYSSIVTHADQLAHKLARALSIALSSPTGPVHLSISSDILAARAPGPIPEPLAARWVSMAMDREAIEALAEALFTSQNPVFYVGDDAGPAAQRLLTLADGIGANVVSSPAGKRWVTHSDPSYCGVLGFSGHVEAARAVAAADLLIAFGATFDELSTNAWAVIPRVPLYSVDRHIGHAYRVASARPVIADPGRAIDWLCERAPQSARSQRKPKAPRSPCLVRGSSQAAVHPTDLMRWLSHELPEDVVVHVDAGNSFSWSTRDLVRTRPDTYRVAMGLSTMCWAIGAVIGAAVASPRRTLCICGDGSMLMSSLELTVAVEQNLPVTYMVLNDSGLGMVRHGQRLAGAESIAHEIAPVRFDRLAKACGARGTRVSRVAQLARVPRAWLSEDAGGPCVIDVCIDRSAVPPMADRVLGLAVGIPK
ncbi:MAG: thiamine pyrophosphate-binding protein [Gammaproteobacteria bacterium]